MADNDDGKPVQIQHRALLLSINELFRPEMEGRELYETARGVWVVGENREQAEYAIATYHGEAVEVYRIEKWHPAGTLSYKFRDTSNWKSDGRWEFEGEVAEVKIRRLYVGKFVGKSGQNPVRYANI